MNFPFIFYIKILSFKFFLLLKNNYNFTVNKKHMMMNQYYY